MEERGIPSVCIYTEAFMDAAAAHFKSLGRPDMHPVPIGHPVLGVGPDELREKAEKTIDNILAILTGEE